jgi:hypothetical protein
VTTPPDVERRYRELESSLGPDRERTAARGPIGLVAVLLVLCLGVGVVAAVDLRRLQTPRGTALAWTSAAVFGHCTAYERLSLAAEDDSRHGDQRCRELRRATEQARERPDEIGLEVVSVQERGRGARVEVRLRRSDRERSVTLPLRRKGDGWGVLLTDQVCRAVGCA